MRLPVTHKVRHLLLSEIQRGVFVDANKRLQFRNTLALANSYPEKIDSRDTIEISEDRLTALKLRYPNYFVDIDFPQEPEFEDVQKHLPGKHDQSSHARGGSGSRTRKPPKTSYSSSEKEAGATFATGNGALQVNGRLRGKGYRYEFGQQRLGDKRYNDTVKGLDSAIGKSTTTRPMTMTRDVDTSSLKFSRFRGDSGRTISDKGFLTMRNTQSGVPPLSSKTRLSITVPAGSKALELSKITRAPANTWVLPRGSKIRLTGSATVNGVDVVTGEIVG